MGKTIGDLLENTLAAPQFAESGSIRFVTGLAKAETLSYRELTLRAMRVAGYLRRHGINPGQRVAIISGTHPDFYAGFFGVMLVGAVPCALYPPLRLGRLNEWQSQTLGALQSIRAKHILVERRFQGLLHHTLAGYDLPVSTLDAARDFHEPLFAPSDDVDAHAVIQLSSGTTGAPRPVELTHHQILSNLAGIREILPDMAARPSGVSWLPLYHDMGLFGKLFMGLLTLGDLTLISPELFLAKPLIWLEELHRSRATISAAPNFAFGVCVKRIKDDFSHLDLSSWRMAICGAETIQNHTFAAFARKFARVGFDPSIFSPAYGLAEATLALTCVPAKRKAVWTNFGREPLTRYGKAVVADTGEEDALAIVSLGKPLSSVSLKIVDEESNTLGEMQVGHILAKGPSVAGVTRSDGWFDTGDLGFLYQGELHFLGRAKDIVIVNGRNFDPAVFEAVAQRVEGIRQGCVVCFSTSFAGEDTESLVVLAEQEKGNKRPADELAAALVLVIRQELQIVAKVCQILKAGSLPRTSSGKLRRFEAKRLWCGNNLAAPKPFGVYRFLMASQLGKLKAWRRRGGAQNAELV